MASDQADRQLTADGEGTYLSKHAQDASKPLGQQHQHNDNAIRHAIDLGGATGLTTLGVRLVRVTQGHDSTEYHRHLNDEEFVYILSGRGVARVGESQFEIHAGDYLGYRKNGPAHCLSNPYEEDLVYLMAGTRSDVDICEYPDLQIRQVRVDGVRYAAKTEDFSLVSSKPLTDANDHATLKTLATTEDPDATS